MNEIFENKNYTDDNYETAYKVIKLAMLMGEAMLSNGAESFRIEDTTRRVINSYGYSQCEAFVTSTGIFITIDRQQNEKVDLKDPLTLVKRINERTINLDMISKINQLSRNIANNEILIDDAFIILDEIKKQKTYKVWFLTTASAVSCFAFCYIFGGAFLDCVNALIIGIVVYIVSHYMSIKNLPKFIINLVGGFVIATIAVVLLRFGIGSNLATIIGAGIMPLIPGMSFTNAIRDILEGDFLSGTSRIAEATIYAIAIAIGVGFVLSVCYFI